VEFVNTNPSSCVVVLVVVLVVSCRGPAPVHPEAGSDGHQRAGEGPGGGVSTQTCELC